MEFRGPSQIAQPDLAAAVDAATTALAKLQRSGLTPANNRDAITVIREIEVLKRKMDSITVDVMAEIQDNSFYAADGHRSAKVMVENYANLSGSEATARDKSRKVLADMHEVAAAYRRGEVGTEQVRVLGRIHANPRVRSLMRDDQAWFLHRAKRLDFDNFAERATKWMNLMDEDGPDPAVERGHERRNAHLTQDYDTSWQLMANYAAAQGAAMHEIFTKYVEAETMADWEKARAEHGADATYNDLARSIQQRRADALWQLFQDAAASPHGAVPPGFTHNIVWDSDTFEEMARRVETGEAEPLDPDSSFCMTLDGVPLDPHESFASALNSRIRRVLIDSASVVIDLGEARRFTGLARHAVKLSFTECAWIGCHVPTSQCEADHLLEHGRGGRTNPGNGAPLCGRHNRWKQKGFTVYRDPTGQWHTYRPDGTKIPAR